MHPRRSNSLTCTGKVSDLNGTTTKARPKKATSLDVDTGVGGTGGSTTTTNGAGLGDGDSDQGRPQPSGDLASTALTVAHNAYVSIESRADELLDRLDETFEAIENGPIGQTAINTVHRVGEVIDDRVLKRVKLAPEVEEVLHGIENTEVVRVAIEKVREAKDYGERILTRLSSQESEDENVGVDFVIPPHFVKAQTPYSNSYVLPHNRSASFDQIDPYVGTVDVSPFSPDLPDDVSYRVPGGFVDLTPDDSDRKNHHHLLRQRNDSLCSVVDSEPYFEFVKSNPTFRSPPFSQPPAGAFPRSNSTDIFDPRKSILVQCNHRGEVKNALIDVPADSNGRSNDFSVPSKYNGGENPRFVRFIERYGGGASGGLDPELCPSTKAILQGAEDDSLGVRGLPDSIICGKAFTQYNISSNSNSNDVDETSPLLEKGRRLPSITEAKKRTRNDQEKHRHLPACPPRRRRRLLPPIPQKQPLPHPNLLKQDKPRKLQRQDSKHPKDEGDEPSQEKPPMQYLQVPPRIQPQAPPPPPAPKPKPRTENLHLYIPGVGFPQDPNRPLPLPNVRQGVKLSGLTEEQILDKFHGRMHDLVCIDGEMYYIVKKAKRKGTLGVFGGASMLLEGSSEDHLDKLSGADGRDPNSKRPTWVRRFFSGLENFINNAHDPWLSEADRDPLACEGCGRWFKKWFHVGGRRSTIGLSNYTNNETFCVVSKRFRKNYVHRFSASKSLFLFSPWHPLRRAAIFLSTNQYFDYIVMTTILLNCVFLAMTKPVDEAEYMFLAIYSMEMMIKTVAKGFILNKYTYLRNPWNWLDFVVIASGYFTIGIELGNFDLQLGNLAGLRTFRVLRALKTVSIMPGLKTIINALLNSIKQLVEVMTLTVFCLMVFALFALQVYMGVLKNKCVKNFDQVNSTDEEWSSWVTDKRNWYCDKGSEHQDNGSPILCGNATGARKCPEGYACLPDIGENPNFGYTNFDNFLWSMLTTFQLITLDYWEDVYNKIIATGGPLQVIFFSIVVFFGSFYLINLMLAVVAMSYEEEAENTEEEKTKDLMDHRDDSTFSFDPEKLTHAKPLEKKKPKNRRIIVMRRGAGILSDTFSKRKNKKKDKNGSASASATPEHESPKGPIAPMKIKEGQLLTIDPPPRRGSQQVSSRPASLIITRDTPPTVGSPAPAPPPTGCNAPPRSPLPEARVRIIAGEGPVGGPGERVDNDSGAPRTAGSSTCEPCTSASRARCCQCQCHTGVARAGHESHGVVAVRGGDAAAGEGGEGLLVPGTESSAHGGAPPRPMPCDDPSRPHLRLANNAPHRQPSLDDSGVVGDHDGGDNISLHHMPNLIQEPESKAELMVYTRKKCNGVSPSSPAALSASSQHIVVMEDELEDRNCEKCRECCVNYRFWLKFQNKLNNIVVQGALFDLFITLCIILNTIFLAIEHHGMSRQLQLVLEVGNRVFTVVFTLECILKIMALSREFFVNRWNVFDLVIVLASLLDLGLEIGSGLSVLRGMRLLRVLKLAQSWRTMRVLLSIIVSTLGALGNLTFVLIIIIYIFAVIGMQLFGEDYTEKNFYPDPIPRWNFTDFFHSFMMIFRILCGEWVEPLWDCMRAGKTEKRSETCLAIFLPALVMGNFMVLNLFLALLLNSFNSEELKSRQDDMEDESKVVLLLSRVKDAIFRCLRIRSKKEKKELKAEDEITKLDDDVRADVLKQAFSEPELRQRCDDEEDLVRGDPQTQGYERMNIVDDDRPEIIELSDMHPTVTNSFKNADASREYSYAHRQEQETLESTYTQESTYAPSQHCSEHENEYRQLQYPEINLQQETSSYNNEDSVSEINLSDSNISKMKLNEVNFPEMKKDLQKGNEPVEGMKKNVPLNKTQSWSTVINYVENITSGVKDDDDPRFMKQERKIKEPVDCFPRIIYKKIPCCTKCTQTRLYERWYNIRRYILFVVDSPYFEWFILLMIFASSVTLCFEDVHLDSKKELKEILNYLNIAFAVLFTIEMFLKWISFGFVKYFTSVWTLLDCFIVLVSVCSLFIEQDNLIALRSLRTLRALRPLRAISRWQGMKIVVNALMYAIPSIFNVLLVCLVFWLIFSIMGVQMFGGKFYKCINNATGELLPVSEVENHKQCDDKNYTWTNSKINFDHVGYAYLALFQVATFEGWMEVMEDAVDCRGIDKQPSREANIYAYIYFVIFIVCGSFFTLNLFIGVIIDNFNMLKKKYEGGVLEMFLTDSQKNYYTAMKKLGRKKPQKVIRRPKHHYHALFYDIAVSRRFEISIFVLIFLNMVTMAIEHYHQTRTIAFTLEVFNALFTTIFALEAIVKMIGLRHHYFTVPWNLFDFILVFASIMGIVLQDVLTDFPISPTLLRVVRVFRIGRILRLIKPTVNGRGTFFGQAAKGIRKLLFALIVSLPALFNIGALLFLITFIYAIIGMAVFGHVQRNGALDDLVNFETFGSSMMLLFRLITSAGWNDVLDPLMAQPPECDKSYMNQPNGNCGHPIIAIVFFVSFIIINFMIVINMYIAVILENFNQAHKEEEIGIVEDDLEMFYVRWSKYDPHATQFINFSQLSDFIASLDAPFGIPKPNTVALVSFDLPIAKGDKIHCLDILHALTKHVLGHVEETEEFKRFPPQLKMQMEEKFKKQFPTRKELEIVSSTRRWKKMDTAAKTIQLGWRVFLRRRRELDKKNLLLEEAQTQTSSPGGSSIRSGFKRVSNLLQVVPMPMAIQTRRRSVNHGDGGSRSGSRRASRSSINEHTTSPRGSLLFFPISRRASRTSQSSNPSLISVQIHQTGDRHSTHSQHSPDYILHEKTIDFENS
ncbi:sodium channel protein 1 brain-like isoform X2 [Oratosquilla oratoria]|uniref:sodium channel protein 1 brain-like isoform X2 n=1 Tax=Oratosquilla oratoria TaxID=337810 RepID=UPI003F76C425